MQNGFRSTSEGSAEQYASSHRNHASLHEGRLSINNLLADQSYDLGGKNASAHSHNNKHDNNNNNYDYDNNYDDTNDKDDDDNDDNNNDQIQENENENENENEMDNNNSDESNKLGNDEDSNGDDDLSEDDATDTNQNPTIKDSRRVRKQYDSFFNAREWARSLQLKGVMDWRRYVKTNQLPPGIPKSPCYTYRNSGWAGYPDFLTGRICRPGPKPRLPDTSTLLKKKDVKFTNSNDDRVNSNPTDIRKIATFESTDDNEVSERRSSRARRVPAYVLYGDMVSDLAGLVDDEGIVLSDAILDDLPRLKKSAKDGFNNSSKGSSRHRNKGGRIGKVFLSWSQSKSWLLIHTNIDSYTRWSRYTSTDRPNFIPSNPPRYYINEWRGWNDFLNVDITELQRNAFSVFSTSPGLITFAQAARVAQILELNTLEKWNDKNNYPNEIIPNCIPRDPSAVFDNEWISWECFSSFSHTGSVSVDQGESPGEQKRFGWGGARVKGSGGRPKRKHLSMNSLDEPVRKHSYVPAVSSILVNSNSANTIRKLNSNGRMSSDGRSQSKNNRRNDWSTSDDSFFSFSDAKMFAETLGLLSKEEWVDWYTNAKNKWDASIKTNGKVLKDNLDTARVPIMMLPKAPDKVYRYEGWMGWGDFLGKGNDSDSDDESGAVDKNIENCPAWLLQETWGANFELYWSLPIDPSISRSRFKNDVKRHVDKREPLEVREDFSHNSSVLQTPPTTSKVESLKVTPVLSKHHVSLSNDWISDKVRVNVSRHASIDVCVTPLKE